MNISLAHSPDADDIFMYYAIDFGWVDIKDYKFSNIALRYRDSQIERH